MIALVSIDWPEAEVVVPDILATLGVLLVAGAVWWIVTRAGSRWIARLEARGTSGLAEHEVVERHQRYVTLWSVLRTLAFIGVAIVTVLVIFSIWGVPLGPFLAVGTVVGVGVGLGAQDLVKSVIAGFMIVIEDQYGIDDVVSIAGVSGKVEAIRLRTTVLRDLEGNVHHVSNGEILVASNLTQGFSAVVIDVSVGYSEDIDRVIEVLTDEAIRFSQDETWAPSFLEPPQVLGVNRLGEWGVEVRAVFTTVTEQRWATKREFLRRIKTRLDAEGLEIAFPGRTLLDRPGGLSPGGPPGP